MTTAAKIKRERVTAYLLIALGLLGPIGYVVDSKAMKGLGLAWMISPLPIVFSDSKGYEAFAGRFNLELRLQSGEKMLKRITYVEAGHLRGPYNRRNVYGAVIGYAPRLPIAMVESALRFGFCDRIKTSERPALSLEFELPPHLGSVALLIEGGTTGRPNQKFRYGVECTP